MTQERNPVAAKAMSSARLTLHPPRETDPELLALIERAKNHKMTPEEVDAQRRSWVRGQMGLRHTTEQIDAALNAVLGPPLSAQLAAAREAGKREGMEEAAKIADDFFDRTCGDLIAGEIADAIRAKLEGV